MILSATDQFADLGVEREGDEVELAGSGHSEFLDQHKRVAAPVEDFICRRKVGQRYCQGCYMNINVGWSISLNY